MPIRRVCALLAVLGLSLPVAAATYYVSPTGDPTVDTPAIQSALDYCAMSDPGCTIELGAGQFFIQQIAVSDFHGRLRGAGVGTTVVSPMAALPVKKDFDWNSYPTPAGGGNEWPILLTFIGGNVNLSDISFEVPQPVPTTGWLDRGGNELFHIWAVVAVTGQSAQSSIERISVNGVTAPSPGPGYSVLVGVELGGFVGPWMGGRHSVSSSSVESARYGVEAWRLQDAQLTIRENELEDCGTCIDAVSANSSIVEVSRNMISSVGGAAVGLWSYEATEMSVYEARHNTVRLPPDAWGRAFCVVDHANRSYGVPTHKAIVQFNNIEMMATSGQQGINTDSLDKALIAGNTIIKSGPGWAILANHVSNSQYLNNDLAGFEKSPKINLQNSTDNLLVIKAASDVQETGGAGNKVIAQGP